MDVTSEKYEEEEIHINDSDLVPNPTHIHVTMSKDLDEMIATKTAVHEMAGEKLTPGGVLVVHWTTAEVANWLVTIGYNDLIPIFHRANINGLALTRLNDNLLREIGVLNVGTRLQFMNEVIKIQAVSRSSWRNTILWKGEEYRPNCCFFLLPWSFPCCCFEDYICGKPSIYSLTNSRLNIINEKKWCSNGGNDSTDIISTIFSPICLFSCCLFSLCTGNHGILLNSTNIDLSLITDLDTHASTSKFGEPSGKILIKSIINSTILTLKSSECQEVASLINSTRGDAAVVLQLTHPGHIVMER